MDKRILLMLGVIFLSAGVYGTFYFRNIVMIVISCTAILLSLWMFASTVKEVKNDKD